MTEKDDALPDFEEFLNYDDEVENVSLQSNSGLPTQNPVRTPLGPSQRGFNADATQTPVNPSRTASEGSYGRESQEHVDSARDRELMNAQNASNIEQDYSSDEEKTSTFENNQKKKEKKPKPQKAKLPKRSKYRIEPPEKHKGKVILEYGDGAKRVRPEMTQLIQHNSKIAWQVFLEEYPDSVRVWWDKYRYTPKVLSLVVGLIIGLFIAASWQYAVPLLGSIEQIPETPYNQIIIFYLTIVSTLLSGLSVLTLFVAALVSRHKDIKNIGKEYLEEEKFGKTVFRFVPVALYYGPLFIIVLLIKSIFGLITFMGAVAKAT